jgi:lysophospholipase L1-like esterase
MIRPLKIFFYFILIALWVILLDQLLNSTGISFVSGLLPDTDLPGDSALTLSISPDEALDNEDSLSVAASDTLVVTDGAEIHLIDDSILSAPPEFRRRYETFCRKAENARQQNRVIRVLHLGDSQIEADRITGILRRHFQNLYGGGGPGFIMPYDPLHVYANVELKTRGNWQLEYSYRKSAFPGLIRFGFSGKAVWFDGQEGSFSLSPIGWKPERMHRFPNIRLLTTVTTDSTRINFTTDDNVNSDTLLLRSDSLQIISSTSFAPPHKITITCKADQSPIFHGITLDDYCGVAVDNISMRGRLWPGMRLANQEMLKTMGEKLNIGLIIVQFGTNVLPTVTDNYNFYRIHFVRELQLLQNILPHVPVLVIGVQSAATMHQGKAEPLRNAHLISEAQRSAAIAGGMGFFDLHKAMGGTKGAITWANEEPSLMLKDYMHFSASGARIVGNKIWNTLDSLRINPYKNRESE